MRRIALIIAASLVVASASSAIAVAAPAGKTSVAAKKSKPSARAKKSSFKQCSAARKGAKRKCKRVAMFQGHGASASSLRKDELAKPTGNVWLYAENLAQEARVNIYKTDGTFDDAALAALDELFRCRQTGEVRAVRPELYEQLSRISDHFGGDKRVELVSGFRFAERSSSRHFHASAMDIRIKGVSIRDMYKYAESLDGGDMGIGLYPTSNFVHVDYRAPGERSYRWTDWSGSGSGNGKAKKAKKSKRPTNRTQPARKPVS